MSTAVLLTFLGCWTHYRPQQGIPKEFLYTKYMNDETRKPKIAKLVILSLLYAVGPLFFMLTDPDKIPLPLLILPFLWLFAVVFITARLVLQRRVSATNKQVVIVSSLLACLVVLLLVFQSIHQLTIRDVLISLAIIGIAAVYLLRADFISWRVAVDCENTGHTGIL